MARPFAIVGLVVLAFLIGATTVRLSGEDDPTVVVCAPCEGRDFGVAAGTGMVLMRTNGLYFYPLDRSTAITVTLRGFPPEQAQQTKPIHIGNIGAYGGPLTWLSK